MPQGNFFGQTTSDSSSRGLLPYYQNSAAPFVRLVRSGRWTCREREPIWLAPVEVGATEAQQDRES